jgi:uncharacterized protein
MKSKILLLVFFLYPFTVCAAGGGDVDKSRFGEQLSDDAFGAFQRGFYKTALTLALDRANKGDPNAQTLAAEIYANGLGTPQNLQTAARLYGLATTKNIPEAQFQTALFLIEGKIVAKDKNKAKIYFAKAALSLHPLAAFNLAQILLNDATTQEQKKRAYDLFFMAANKGLKDAQYAVAQFLLNGTGGISPDAAQARLWIEKAAHQNYDTAQLDLGSWLIYGIGGSRDYEKGFLWIKRAAISGNREAMRRLAHLYENGIGVKGDPIAAAAWYISVRRKGVHDKELDDLLDGLSNEELKTSLVRAATIK